MTKILLFLCMFTTSLCCFADGGRIRLHEQAGPFVVTLFTTPDPLSEGPADFSVAVERQGAVGLVQDADITLVLTQQDSASDERMVLTATHQAATSRFLQAANFTLPHAGVWRVKVIVSQGSDVGECSGLVDVQPTTTLGNQTFWQIVAVPFAVMIFFLHQKRKARQRRKQDAVKMSNG